MQSWVRFPLSFSIVAGMMAIALPDPATAFDPNQFRICAAELQNADISVEQATSACSEALNPKDLSFCVLKINGITNILSTDALAACFRVRRPLELSSCVVEINKETRDPVPLNILDYCRRSLLPVRYSQCVVGLSRAVDIDSNRALASCIAADDYPRNLAPIFAPPAPQNPTYSPDFPPIPSVTPTTPITP